MKIVFDTETCKTKNVDVGVALYLISALAGSMITADTFEKARKSGYLDFTQRYERGIPAMDPV